MQDRRSSASVRTLGSADAASPGEVSHSDGKLTSGQIASKKPAGGSQRNRAAEGRFEVLLGDLRQPWFDFCKAHRITPSEGIKQALHRMLQGAPPDQPYDVHPAPEAKVRLELKLTESELAAARSRADLEGFASVNRWAVASVRATLTQTAQFGEPEVEALTQSNVQLMRIGRNLNQVTRRLNAGHVGTDAGALDPAFADELSEIIRKHVKKVGDVLHASVYRWALSADARKHHGD